MSKPTKRNQNFIHILLIGLLTIVAIWSYSYLQDANNTASIAQNNYARSKKAATYILTSNSQSKLAGTQKLADAEISRTIDNAAKQASIPSACIQGTYPGSPRRIADSAFKEMPTEVPLRNITLKQLITFLHHLSTGPSKLRIKSLRLDAPRKKILSNRWNADIILTYLLYSVDSKKK